MEIHKEMLDSATMDRTQIPRLLDTHLHLPYALEAVREDMRVKADEAKAIGLAAQVYPAASWLDDAKALARTIAEKPPVAARLATEAVDLAWNSTLDAGLEFERKAFYLLFATEDKKEGVDAFVNKRKATFKGK